MANNNMAYGFHNLSDVQRIENRQLNEPLITQAIATSVEEHNRIVNGALATWALRTTDLQERFLQVKEGTLQPVADNGRADPVVPDSSVTVAYPISKYESAFGTTTASAAMMSTEAIGMQVAAQLNFDKTTVRNRMLSAILDEVTWTFVDPVASLTIKPLANGDTDEYVVRGGSLSTADHYLFQNAIISDTNPAFPTIFNQLFSYPSNNVSAEMPIISLVAQNLAEDIEGLTNLIEPRVPGAVYNATDFMDQTFSQVPPWVDRYLGRINGCEVFVWNTLPDDYIISWASGAGQFLKMREYPAAELQGLRSDIHSVDGNQTLNYYTRRFGFGAYNRIAANVMMIDEASYVVPSGYTASIVTGA